ncbi:MAG: MarR family winged helix-turn-helix transcriptional regulator [Aliiglaciecola sp.]|uniref:MarR family winged helix-turn-helix transcriptional regulator n=1 Tax=Aliiglaciecola sp. TaxID=1872441 RepID=UPI0032977FAD
MKNTDVLLPILLAEKIDKISSSIRKQLEIAFVSQGVSVTQGLILYELFCHVDITTTQRALAIKQQLPRYSVSRNIDALESLGYVKRLEDPDSARRVLVSLTETGNNLASILSSIIRSVYKDAFSNLDKKEQADLFKILCKL